MREASGNQDSIWLFLTLYRARASVTASDPFASFSIVSR